MIFDDFSKGEEEKSAIFGITFQSVASQVWPFLHAPL